MKNNLLLFIVISLFLLDGCLKNNSNTSSVVESVDGECTYIYPIYEKKSSSPSRYCLTRCTKCPEENKEIFNKNEKDYIQDNLCPLEAENTEYFEGQTIIDQFSRYVGSKDELTLHELEKEDTLKSDIYLLYQSKPIKIKDKDEAEEKCSRNDSNNKGILVSDSLLSNIKEKYRIVKCDGETLGFANIQSKLLYIYEKKEIKNFQEAKDFANSKKARLLNKDECTEEIIKTTFMLLTRKGESYLSLGNFWLSQSIQCSYDIYGLAPSLVMEEIGESNPSMTIEGKTVRPYITGESKAKPSLKNVLVVKEYSENQFCKNQELQKF